MKFTALKSYIFYPNVNGNLDLPESERLSVEITRPTAEDFGTLASLEIAQKNHKDDEDRSVFRYNVPKILRNYVRGITNLTVEDADNPGKEKTITNGKELAEASFAGMFPLVNAICTEICAERMNDAQKKILEPDSSSSGTDGTSAN